MADAIGWITDVFAVQLATIGTVQVTLGYVVAVTLVTGYAMSTFKKAKGR